jgi:predicted ATP-dependent serine protease
MALIICSECGKEYSDRATACPNCACPNPCVEHATKSFASESSTKATINFRPIIIAVIIIALIAVVSGHVHKVNLYNRGLDAL